MHTIQSSTSPQDRQADAHLHAAHIIKLGLPRAEWKVTRDGKLCGHVDEVVDRDARQAMRRFAEFLGARLEVSQGRNQQVEHIHLCVSATYRGVPVTVWTHVDVRPVTRKVIETAGGAA